MVPPPEPPPEPEPEPEPDVPLVPPGAEVELLWPFSAILPAFAAAFAHLASSLNAAVCLPLRLTMLVSKNAYRFVGDTSRYWSISFTRGFDSAGFVLYSADLATSSLGVNGALPTAPGGMPLSRAVSAFGTPLTATTSPALGTPPTGTAYILQPYTANNVLHTYAP